MENVYKPKNWKRYIYRGPVFQFGKLLDRDFEAYSMAVSPQKALNNITYRYKFMHNMVPASKITLDISYLEEDPTYS